MNNKEYFSYLKIVNYLGYLLGLSAYIFGLVTGPTWVIGILTTLLLLILIYDYYTTGQDPIDYISSKVKNTLSLISRPKDFLFVIGFKKNSLELPGRSIPHERIKNYFTAKGGSEPYITLQDDERIDLQTSWLSKKKRVEVKAKMQEIVVSS